MRYEVCNGHVACEDERDRTCEQAEHDQRRGAVILANRNSSMSASGLRSATL
jgi:hypothetical protein